MVKTCDICMHPSQPRPTEAPLQPWSLSDRPWSRLHIDYAGPFMGSTGGDRRPFEVDRRSTYVGLHLSHDHQ